MRKSRFILVIGILTTIVLGIVGSRCFWHRHEAGPPCDRRLWRIGIAILLYEKDHEGVLPKDLDTLVSSGYLAAKDLRCPNTMGGMSNYRYFGGGRTSNAVGATEIIAADPVGAHRDGGNVLFGEGSTLWLKAAEFQSVGLPSTQPLPPS